MEPLHRVLCYDIPTFRKKVNYLNHTQLLQQARFAGTRILEFAVLEPKRP